MSSSPVAQQIETGQGVALSELKRRWAIHTGSDLKQRCKELGCGSFLIGGLIPRRTISIVAGDSGIGKSPLLYQAALCVAAGVPFLGRPVSQGRVLYLDFENGLDDVNVLVSQLSRHLGLTETPENLLTWNYNDAPPRWDASQLSEMIRDVRPVWVLIDSLSGFAPECEDKASNVTHVFQRFRQIISKCETAITVVHHLKKPSVKPQEAPPRLEENPRQWFLQVRGSGDLVNGSDVRIGVATSVKAKHGEDLDGRSHDVALVLGGFGRVRGKIATTFVARALDEDDEPLGYHELAGVSLLFNPGQEEAYRTLPDVFKFKDAQRVYGKGPQATTDFLKKCTGVGILRKDGKEYRKVEIASGRSDGRTLLFSMSQHPATRTEQAGVYRSKRIHSAMLRRTPISGRSGNLLLIPDLEWDSAHSARTLLTHLFRASSPLPCQPIRGRRSRSTTRWAY